MNDGWYYAEASDRSYGPMTIEELGQVLQTRTNAADFLVWCPGMSDWARAGEQSALRKYFEPPPISSYPRARTPEGPANRTMAQSELPQSERGESNLYPWRRYFARTFDLYVFCLFFFVFLGVAVPQLFASSEKGFDALYGIFGAAIYAVFEGFWINVFGASLGKRLHGLRLIRTNDDGFTLAVSFRRSFAVWAKGLGIGIPIVSLFTLITAYRTLQAEGQTSWDRDYQCAVIGRHLSAFRWIFILVVWALFIAIYMGLVALGSAET